MFEGVGSKSMRVGVLGGFYLWAKAYVEIYLVNGLKPGSSEWIVGGHILFKYIGMDCAEKYRCFRNIIYNGFNPS